MEQKDLEQDRMIQENAVRISRNEAAIKRQTEALEKIRDHFYPPPKKFWRRLIGWVAKACCAVFAYLGIAETVDWIWNARQSDALAERFAQAAERLFTEEGDARAAATCYEQAIKLNPKDPNYVIERMFMKGMALAESFLDAERPLTNDEQARVDTALAEAFVLRNLQPDNPSSDVLVSQALVLSGEYDDAVLAIRRAVAHAPERAVLRISACAMLYFSGKKDEAREHLAEAERLGAPTAMVASWKGLFALTVDKDADKARSYFREVTRHHPRLPNGHILLGRAFLAGEKPDFEGARAEFQRTLVLDAKRRAAMMGMAEVCERTGKLVEARIWLDQAIANDSNNLPAFVARARINGACGNWKCAVEDLSMAITISPFRADLYRLRAEANDKAGDSAQAKVDRTTADALAK